ncbi:hypothetical protein QZH41_017240 [Actinostola sp. cb2023]|nr:hypothetical protein QZH41_017240 [Actinostola sp. cb2023]
MSLLKGTVILGIVLVFTSYVSAMDFSYMDFVRDAVMKYSSGTERTVQVSKPKLVVPLITQPKVSTSMPVVPSLKKIPDYVYGGGGASGASGASDVKRTSYGKVLETSPMLWKSSLGIRPRPGGGGASGGSHKWLRPRPRPVTPKVELTYTKQNVTYRRRTAPSNKFLEAITAIERGVAEAKAAERWNRFQRKNAHLQATKHTLKLAVQNRMFQFARNKLGQALFYIKRDSSRRPKRSTQNQASSFMDDLKQSMGPAKFDEFMAVMGDVTLMFAIDTTGSMSDEIATAKRIAVDVINYPRQNPVSYILSPFNDPSTGPVIFRESTEGLSFVKAISNLKAKGGGDCPELTLKGILDALYEGPDWGSPLYVFTDASAKDATRFNIEEVKEMAQLQGITINFFTTGRICRHNVYKPFQELAEATSGQVLSLIDQQELQQMTGFTGSVLGGSNIISSGSNMSNRKKRRAVGSQRYSIKIDDSIEKMSVCITTERPSQGTTISLTDPRGVKITSGKVSMSKVSIYEITKPKVGTWTLVVSLSAGKHSYFAKSTSDTNIDFEHYFMLSIPGPVTDIPVSDPLIGRQTKLVLTMAGYHKVQKNTVVLELITKYGEHIRDVSLTPDNKGMRYVATFTPPSRAFKLKLKGTTKAGNAFERISRNIIEPKHVLLRVLRSDKDFTLRRNQTSTVTFHLFNAAASDKLEIDVKDRLGYVAKPQKSRRTRITKTYNTRSTPSNKFLEALTTVERGVADAKAARRWLRYSPQKLQSLKNTIKLAAGKRMFQYSRHRLGEALFLLGNSSAASSRPKRSTQNQASSFMDDLKQSMGPAKFDEFMAVMGDVTLMFAIDTTGSMSDEIGTAKRIAVDVINYPRQNPVSYILSPFNDPSTGPVTFKDNTQGALFVDAINKLSATGGGDCPELTLKGILDALYEGPDWGSPLYVFTDASAKDATPSNMEEAKSMAQYLGVTINFFTTGTHNVCFVSGQTCGNVYKPFQELAEATSGQVLSLSNHHELQRLTGFTGSVLGGSNIISSGSNMSNRKKRRAVGDKRYSIKIDDSIEKMSVCITTERPNKGTTISLTDPLGKSHNHIR